MSARLESIIELLDLQHDLMCKVGLFKRYFEEWFKVMSQRPASAWMFSNVITYADKNPEWPHLMAKDLRLAEALLDIIAPDRPGRMMPIAIPTSGGG